MKRIQKGPVRGISLRLQEEERERKLDYAPEKSVVNTRNIIVDPQTLEMVKALDLDTANIRLYEPKQN
jgi:small subunit ribosomal protein S17e